MAYRGFKPLFDRVLVQRVVAETKTKVFFMTRYDVINLKKILGWYPPPR